MTFTFVLHLCKKNDAQYLGVITFFQVWLKLSELSYWNEVGDGNNFRPINPFSMRFNAYSSGYPRLLLTDSIKFELMRP